MIDLILLIFVQRTMQQSLATSVMSSASLVTEVEQQKLALSSERQELEDLESADRSLID